jgi:hypothetical protein
MEEIVLKAKKDFSKPFFIEIILIACWNIWKVRNGVVFGKIVATFRSWKGAFIHDPILHKYRVKGKILPELSKWIDSLL